MFLRSLQKTVLDRLDLRVKKGSVSLRQSVRAQVSATSMQTKKVNVPTIHLSLSTGIAYSTAQTKYQKKKKKKKKMKAVIVWAVGVIFVEEINYQTSCR